MKTYRLDQAGEWLTTVHKDLREAAGEGLLSAAHRTVNHIQANVIPATDPMPVDKGTYRAAWKAERYGDNGAIVYNDAPHAAVIENGGKAESVHIGRDMIKMLTEWVQRKGIGGRTVAKRDGSARVVKATATEAMSIAWAIAKSMQVHGMFKGRGLRVFEKASREIPRFVREEVAEAIRKKVGR